MQSQPKPLELISRALGIICLGFFTALTLVVLWQVISRYALTSPSSASEELARILLMWLGLLGACYAHSQDAHIAIRLFQGLPRHVNRARDQLIAAACQAFSLVLMVGGIKLCQVTYELNQRTPVMDWPVALVYSVIPAAGLLLAIFSTAGFLRIQNGEAT